MEQWELRDQHRHEAAVAAANDEGWTVVTRHRVFHAFWTQAVQQSELLMSTFIGSELCLHCHLMCFA